ncbi:MAG: TIGR03960 family B12-binding radical SAM protein [Eggerthellaceae bacterium]|nr:TIGR03960 family B12-binding radical SAM protein [Eggerthellaceae bacterium]
MTDLWPSIEPLLRSVERPSRYINHEFGCTYKPDAEFRFCMIYPDTYELGQSNQAIRILCNAVNAREGFAAERSFLPATDMIDLMRKKHIPLFSLESFAPLCEFDAIGITLPHELAATNILEGLDLARIPIFAKDRTDENPFVLGGGPCAFNPEPFAAFFDVISIGEGEKATPDLLAAISLLKNQGKTRFEILRELSHMPGTYVPSLYRCLDDDQAKEEGSYVVPLYDDVPKTVTKTVFENFSETPGWEPCMVPYIEMVHDRLNMEILRGCARGCRFCQAGMMYRPVRERSADNIVASVEAGLSQTGYDEVSLTSLSTTDHSQIADILMRLNAATQDKGVRISIPSQRLDSFGVSMAGLVAGQKRGGLTFAPEAGTQRLRDVINKNVTEEDLFCAIDAAFAAGWRHCKLYFMIGLPTETDEDIKGIASLLQRAYDHARAATEEKQRGAINISAAIAVFVPKAQTPFQWDGQITAAEAQRRVDLLRRSVKYRAIDIRWHDPRTAFVEACMSRGGRQISDWVYAAWKNGARFDAWNEHFNEKAWLDAAQTIGIDCDKIAHSSHETGSVMPWSHISTGVSNRFFVAERNKAQLGITTPDCTFAGCVGCGACQALHAKNRLAGERHV